MLEKFYRLIKFFFEIKWGFFVKKILKLKKKFYHLISILFLRRNENLILEFEMQKER